MDVILAVIVVAVIAFATQRGNDRRLRQLEEEIRHLRTALQSRPVTEPAPRAVEDSSHNDTSAVAAQAIVPDTPEELPLPVAASTVTQADTSQPITTAPRAESLESWLGARWAVWVGGIALALGGIFMVKYSIESGLLSPAVRLVIAALFGLVLTAAGEIIRRRVSFAAEGVFRNAMVPGVLTAAGAVTLFGVTYAAHGVYGFIGPGAAFAILALLALATLALSLLHGQALAGLGLAGSMATPALVASSAPDIWALFGFLSIAYLSTAIASRLRRWTVVPSLANAGMAIWSLAYIVDSDVLQLLPVTLAVLLMIASVIFLWPGTALMPPAAPIPDPADGNIRFRLWQRLLTCPPLAINLTVALGAVSVALALVVISTPADNDPLLSFAAIVLALAALGASRTTALYPAIISAFGALAGIGVLALIGIFPDVLGFSSLSPGASALDFSADIIVSLGLGLIFILLGLSFLIRHGEREPQFAVVWAALIALTPLSLATISHFGFGNLVRDIPHGVFALFCAALLGGATEWISRRHSARMERGADESWTISWLLIGVFGHLCFALHALTSGMATTVGLAVIGALFVAATRVRPWRALPWMMALAGILTLVRIGWDPTIVGAAHLGTTPVFNALLAGYGIPAVLMAVSAYALRQWPDTRIRNLLQALASLMLLLTVAIVVRHAMNGGTLTANGPTLGEQSIYTLLTVGASAIMMTLDIKSPSPVFRYGSMVVGALSMLSVVFAHMLVLNPFLTGELTGRIPFFNLLLVGYLLPGLAYAGVAYYARDKRPPAYIALLALSGALMAFAWATLSVRWFWQGENLDASKGFLQGETYSYSVVWLLIGVAILGLGSRFDARSLRLSSAALVLIAVVKVFLIDMANLEGFLRALSFIGLGVVLIGIGLFYQRILTGKGRTKIAPDQPAQ